MELEHPELALFEPTLRRLTDLAFNKGIEAIESVGLSISDVTENPSALRRFIRGCHYGYDLAQRQIGSLMIEIVEGRSELSRKLKEARRQRDGKDKEIVRIIRILDNRERVLRRLIDSILYVMLRYQTWIARRLFAEREMHGIDPSVLRRTLDFVVERNQENRLRFSLLTDLTTFVQLGDLVEIDFNPGKGASWKVIELKEGKVNDLISEFLEERKLKLTSSDLQEISEMPGKDLNKQASRMLRQRKELIEFNKILATDRGIDLGTKEEVVLTKEVVTTESYIEEIGRVCVKALESGVASAIVDGCLRIVAAKGEISKKGPGAIAHVFYHMAKPGTDCRLKDGPDSVREELRAMKEMPSYIDLVQQDLHSYWGQPLFLWFHPNMVLDLLFGRVRVFAQFDLAHFFELAKTKGIKMSWITKRNAQESGDYGRLIPGSPGAYAILAVLPNGNKQTLLLGFISRVWGDVVRPKTLLDLILRDPTEFREKISLKPD